MSSDAPIAGGGATTRAWVKLPMPTDAALAPGARVSASAVTHDGVVYLFGGERGGLPLDDLWELRGLGEVTLGGDPAANAKWQGQVKRSCHVIHPVLDPRFSNANEMASSE